MPVRDVLRMGHPVLRERSKPVEAFGTPELKALLEDMIETMAAKSGAGLAAPQIGVLERVVIFGVDHNPRYPDAGAPAGASLLRGDRHQAQRSTVDAADRRHAARRRRGPPRPRL